MSGTSPSSDQPSGQLIANEQVLERLFRAHYARWIADAKGRLGADAAMSAPRVVSKAFHMAWTDRQRFRSQEELDAFLAANIQHGSARELSRRAGLHRRESHSGGHKDAAHDHAEMGVDEAWDRLKHTLQGGVPEASRKRASAARHEAAEHMATLGKSSRNWTMVAIGVVGLAVALVAYWYLAPLAEDRATTHALNAPDVRGYVTGSGQQANVTLDDSTVVRLGPDSKLTVPKLFGRDLRAVRIDGAANFDVTRTLEKPLEVRSGEVAILARGTVFTVRRYKDDVRLVVHVRQGSVDLRWGKQIRKVAEGMSLLVTDSGVMRVPSSEELDEASAWVDGNVAIVGHTLREALPLLKRWYGLDIKVPDATLLDRKVFVRAPMTSQKEAISSVEQSAGVKFTYIGQKMAFQDTLPSKPAARRRTGR